MRLHLRRIPLKQVLFWIGVVLLASIGQVWLVGGGANLMAYGVFGFIDAMKPIVFPTAPFVVLGIVFVLVSRNKNK